MSLRYCDPATELSAEERAAMEAAMEAVGRGAYAGTVPAAVYDALESALGHVPMPEYETDADGESVATGRWYAGNIRFTLNSDDRQNLMCKGQPVYRGAPSA
jgi:hypothetical protein